MSEKTGIFSYFERESIRKMGEDLERIAKQYGTPHKAHPECQELFLSLYKLGVAVQRFSTLNGHMSIWAAFTPDMVSESEELSVTPESEEA